MADAASFTKLVPGFDFLQGLVKNAGSALPNIGQWVAPTLNPEELEKRIEELRTVQFWLEQNARMLGATIQALEVQRMTLSTLKTMNVQMDDLRESMTLRMPTAAAACRAVARSSAAYGCETSTRAQIFFSRISPAMPAASSRPQRLEIWGCRPVSRAISVAVETSTRRPDAASASATSAVSVVPPISNITVHTPAE